MEPRGHKACHSASCTACSLVGVSATLLRTEGNGSDKTEHKAMFWLEIWQSKMEVSLGIDSMCCPQHIPLLLTTRVCTPGTVSELQAAQFGDMSLLPTLWLYVSFWGTAAGTCRGLGSARLSSCSLTHLVCSCCLLQEKKKNKKTNQNTENGLLLPKSL